MGTLTIKVEQDMLIILNANGRELTTKYKYKYFSLILDICMNNSFINIFCMIVFKERLLS